MERIHTVLGEIDSTALGETLFHEHVMCVNTVVADGGDNNATL